jgi:BirA family transcriptional regulator, biotin operon repressor / biotin---[acetyl-CoA-carboxylase] ligase
MQLEWHAPALQQELARCWPGLRLEIAAQCPSTNTVLLERLRAQREQPGATGAPTPTWLVAEHQTHGRGRLQRSWVSSAADSLTFSVSVPLLQPDWSALSLAVGLSLAQALDPIEVSAAQVPQTSPTPRIGLKWPNDLWLLQNGKSLGSIGQKIGGVLIETLMLRGQRWAVIGVGLNVKMQQPPPKELSQGYACLDMLAGNLLPMNHPPAVLQRIALPLLQSLQSFNREGFAPCAELFAVRDVLYGRAVHSTQPEAQSGVAQGVCLQGRLHLQTPHGLRHISSGEVSIRLADIATTTQNHTCPLV